MPKDVIITPASGLIDFKDVSGVSDATIQLSDTGDLIISNANGNISLGNTAANLYIGDGVNSVDIIFEQSGKVRALTGKTLTLGQSDSSVAVASPLTLNSTLTAGTSTFNGNITLPTGAGTNIIKAGTGDGASFTTYNLKINSWWGIGFGDYQDLTTVKAYIDCRTGNFGSSGQFVSTVATGTAPFTVASTTKVTNLNADFVDGASVGTSWTDVTGNTIPIRHAAGYLYSNYFNTPADITAVAPTHVAIQTGSDNYIRWQTLAQFKTNLDVGGGGQFFGSQAVKAIAYNSNIITQNVTVSTGNNAISAGPMTISNGFTVTIANGANWIVV